MCVLLTSQKVFPKSLSLDQLEILLLSVLANTKAAFGLEKNDLWHTKLTAEIRAVEMANGPLQPALHRYQRGLTPLWENLSSARIKQGHNSVLHRVFYLKGT